MSVQGIGKLLAPADDEESQRFISPASSPVLAPISLSPEPRVSPPPDSDIETEPEAEPVPRSPSVASSRGSASSWDHWETSSTQSFVMNMSDSDSEGL